MNMCKVQPVILLGGVGTRLYPLSTPKIPKQFISLGNKGTLLEETIRRISLVIDECRKLSYEVYDPLFIMHHTHKLPPELSKYECQVIYEKYSNDTGVAVGVAASAIKTRHQASDIIMAVFPADHYIYNVDSFIGDITYGISRVTNNNIVLYGINPTNPETKYGYIIPSTDGIKFREKPNATLASELIAQNALWNSGIFAANNDLVLKCLNTYNIMDWVDNPREGKAPSFDVAVLQEHNDIYAHHCHGWRWSDVGTFSSFMELPEIKQEMIDSTSITMSESTNCHVINRSLDNVILIGCKDLYVIANGPNLLIMSNKEDYNSQLKEIATRIG
jgi:mannose-1-phosphate guanylyltransferase